MTDWYAQPVLFHIAAIADNDRGLRYPANSLAAPPPRSNENCEQATKHDIVSAWTSPMDFVAPVLFLRYGHFV